MVLLRILRKSYFSKSIVAFLGVNLLTSLFSTPILALTSGPTAPEYTSFEPVEASDMVNMATGDFTYNLPILEVPGPEGGYPLSLSYHAGIMPEEEASWVGLGWNLNAGAISRNVNGFADDWNRVNGSVWDYLDGGETTVKSWGVSVNIPIKVGTVGIGYGHTSIYDTYKGAGTGHALSVGVGVGINETPAFVGVGMTVSTLPYSDDAIIGMSGSFGFGVASEKVNNIGASLSTSIGVNYNTGSKKVTPELGFSGGVGYGKKYGGEDLGIKGGFSLVNFSINSSSGSRIGTAGSISSSQSNKRKGKISTTESSSGFAIPLYLVNFSYNESYRRYWSSEGAYNFLYGILNRPLFPNSIDESYDAYHLPNLNGTKDQVVNEQDGGMIPSYDNYIVQGQGVGGAIRPQIHTPTRLFKQDISTGNRVRYSTGYGGQNKINFGYVNEFSSYYKINDNVTEFVVGNISSLIALLDDDEEFNSKAFITSTNRKVGAKHIEYYTVDEINNSVAKNDGFIKSRNNQAYRSIVYSRDVSTQIGGFCITNESGVTYHYGLPVYAFNQFTKTYSGQDYHSKTEAHPYAYTWLLTGVTGPNFVDRGEIGVLDEEDYGYWVEFDYGNWSKSHGWRVPSDSEFITDVDNDLRYFSYGEKELFYLDYIKTKSHTAIFEKVIRDDGKGVSDLLNGGFKPVNISRLAPENFEHVSGDEYTKKYPTSVLGLKRILLMDNTELRKELFNKGYNELSSLKSIGTSNNFSIDSKVGLFQNCILTGLQETICYDPKPFESQQDVIHNGEDVILSDDLSHIDLLGNSLSSIEFVTDYSLCNNTPNSLSYKDIYKMNSLNNPVKGGKLTLNGIQSYGRSGDKLIPGIDFEYGKVENNPDYASSSSDFWGFYNRDFIGDEEDPLIIKDEFKEDAKAWSLTKISRPYGANTEISYEADEYTTNVYREIYDNTSVAIKGLVKSNAVDEYEVQLDLPINVSVADFLESLNQLKV